ncbi:MAG TPA: hypothetical protein VKU87_11055 [Thermomicrobiaceae bacterium]|nr:hypothetical protein [Thermomicrobiaceae bacterium]
MRPVYLTGEHVYLRAVQESDKEHAPAWIDSPFPVSQVNAEKIFKQIRETNDERGRVRLIICRKENDEVVGGATVRGSNRSADLKFHMAPWLDDADSLRADALSVLFRWQRNEHEPILIFVDIPGDQPETLEAASRLGLAEGARMTEWIARAGHRVDLVMCQWVSEEVEAVRA